MKTGYINGHLYNKPHTAFLTEDGKFTAFGTDEEIANQSDEVINLQGQYVYPGFFDSHMHLVNLGFVLDNVKLDDCTSLTQIRSLLEKRDSSRWIVARGYNEDKIEEHRIFNRAELDEMFPDTPVCLTRCCGHKMVANSKAMELAGVTKDTAVSGGKIFFEEGFFEENAIERIVQARPEPTVEDIKRYIRLGMACCNTYGVTSVASDDFLTVTSSYEKVQEAYRQLSESGELTVRVNEQSQFASAKDLQRFLDEGLTMGVGNDLYKIGPIKLLMDGSLGARTAYMSEPYHDKPDTCGYNIFTEEDITGYVRLGKTKNMPTIIHTIGDKALDMVLNVYNREVEQGNPLHYGMVHVQITRPDQIQNIIDRKYHCYLQTIFTDYDSMIVKDRVGEERADTSYMFKTLYEGTTVSNGTDCPVEPCHALFGIACAMTHKSMTHPEYSFNEKETLTFEQAMDTYTAGGAKVTFEWDRKGSLDVGKFADFFITKEDLSALTPQQLTTVSIQETYLNGNNVYTAE
ncbi:MAG: amidohydrolase [Erysipelotrichaceae bacterium]|nr:amidohydrolase [Erysipelotrichaceae bacterium]